MRDLSIQEYEKEKALDLCEIHNLAFKSCIDKLGTLYGYENLNSNDIESWIKDTNSKIWIAYDKDFPIGYIHCSLAKETNDNEILTLWFVETLEGLGQSKIAVIPSFRNKGAATALINYALEYYRDLGAELTCAVAYNTNESAINLLSTLGFEHKKKFYYDRYSKIEPFGVDAVIAKYDLIQDLPQINVNPEVLIREIKGDDLPALKQIFGECSPYAFGENPTMEQIFDWVKGDWGEVTLVAEYKNIVVGCMEYTTLGRIGIPGVLKKYRERGIGSTLLYYLLRSMKERGKPMAISDSGYVDLTKQARSMYKRFGFDTSQELWFWIKKLK